ncbi:hypothetical protein E4U43_003032 [Claviceps pusilla]|uniref:Uncharacterized protein n=1 Tax=Claviceps pusilla TaxID=123648 RepID=A0A9P7SVN8_9HYPO|nr:hypothetical protein E4U43_003032 [Claviceps pusilla]
MRYLTVLLAAAAASVSAEATPALDKRLNLQIWCAGTVDVGTQCDHFGPGVRGYCCSGKRNGHFNHARTDLVTATFQGDYIPCDRTGLAYCAS